MKTPIISILRRFVPRKIQTLIRFYQIFNNTYGHSRVEKDLILNGNNEPLPWITYPAIEFLNTIDFKNCDVFEYGSGSSTHYWSSRARTVTSVEKDEAWYHKVKNSLPSNCNLFLKPKDSEYIEQISTEDKRYHVIVVDGAVRYPCMLAALKSLTEDGIILLDNSDWYPKTCDHLRNHGFTQIDFAGFSPLNAFTASTSIFYKHPNIFRRKSKSILPMGRRDIGTAYDDKPLEQIDQQYLLL